MIPLRPGMTADGPCYYCRKPLHQKHWRQLHLQESCASGRQPKCDCRDYAHVDCARAAGLEVPW